MEIIWMNRWYDVYLTKVLNNKQDNNSKRKNTPNSIRFLFLFYFIFFLTSCVILVQQALLTCIMNKLYIVLFAVVVFSSVHFLSSWWHMTLSQFVGKSWKWDMVGGNGNDSYNDNDNATVTSKPKRKKRKITKKWNRRTKKVWTLVKWNY